MIRHLINDQAKITAARAETERFVEGHPDIRDTLDRYLEAYCMCMDLYPCTPDNIMSGNLVPYNHSYYQLECSVELAMMGFYGNAFQSLRSVLELGLFAIFITIDDQEHITVKPWLRSQSKTPGLKYMADRLLKLDLFLEYDQRYGLFRRMGETMRQLHRFVHTQGYIYTHYRLSESNFNTFVEKSFKLYCATAEAVVRDLVISLVLRYPIGMQRLPISAKFGLNGPVGGFLEGGQVDTLTQVIPDSEKAFLQKLSDENEQTRNIRRGIEEMPDISDADFDHQADEWKKEHQGTSCGTSFGDGNKE